MIHPRTNRLVESEELLSDVAASLGAGPTTSAKRGQVLRLMQSDFKAAASFMWGFDQDLKPKLEGSIGVAERGFAEDSDLLELLSRLARQVAAVESPKLFASEAIPDLPPQFSVLAIPFGLNDQRFVAQLLISDELDEANQKDYLGRAQSISNQLFTRIATTEPAPTDRSENPPARDPTDANDKRDIPLRSLFANSEEQSAFLMQIHRSLNLERTALTLVNEARAVTRFDRVALVIKRGRKRVLLAVNGVETPNRRSEEMRSLEKLGATTIQLGQTLTLEDAATQPEDVQQQFADHVFASNARRVVLLPLFRTDDPRALRDDPNDAVRSRVAPACIGCLTFESFRKPDSPLPTAESLNPLAEHASIVVTNCLAVKKVPALRAWTAVGSVSEWLYGRKLMKTLLIMAAVAAVVTTLIFVPYPYRVTAEGALLPAAQQRVYAPIDGDVETIFVTGGEPVALGSPMIQLRNDELMAQRISVANEVNETRQTELSLQSQISAARRDANDDEEMRLRSELQETRVQLVGFEEDLEVLLVRETKLTVMPPAAGVIATFEPEQLLAGRPVRRGDLLVEVMQTEGDWQLELEIEDRRIGRLGDALKAAGSDGLPVEFMLLTASEKTYAGVMHMQDLGTRAALNKDGESVVRAIVSVDPTTLEELRIGAEVFAKVDCGPSHLGEVLFGDVVDFLRRNLWL